MDYHIKLRPFEVLFIIATITIYIVRRLLGIAQEFDYDVGYAESITIPRWLIWRDLAGYDQYLNTLFPTITAALLFTGAWIVFHYFAFPALKRKEYDISTIFLCLLVVLLIGLSCYIYKEFKLFWRFRYDHDRNVIGFKVYSLFRKLHVLTDTLAGIVVLLMYEAIAQLYYYTAQLYEKHQDIKHRLFSHFILGLSALTILFFAFFGKVANLILGLNGLMIGILQIILITGLHYLFFRVIIPFFAKLNYQAQRELITAFLGVLVYGLLLFILNLIWYKIAYRGYFFGLVIVPHFFGFVSALIRWFFFVENKQLQKVVFHKSAELTSLRTQINPHFLFNALNTLYAVSLKENAEKTAMGIQKLGDMMRFMLHENHQERIPISKEIEYLENFIDIQRMRLDENHAIEIRVNLQQPEHEIYIAPMLLNPFVENAFKHGISFRRTSWIFITLTFDATKIFFKVHNSLHPKQTNDTEKPSGIGLENVQKRLELIYPNNHTLDIQQSEQDYFVSVAIETKYRLD